MRTANIPLQVPARLVRDARLYSSRPHDLDAVVYVLEDYPRLIRQIRDLRSRLDDFDREQAAFDDRL